MGTDGDTGNAGDAGDAEGTGAGRRPLLVVAAANVVSVSGDSLTGLAVPWFVLTSTGSAGKAGIVAACTALCALVSAIVAGPVIDRLGPRAVSIASDLVCALTMAAVPLLATAGALRFPVLCALTALAGLCQAPGVTARGVLLPGLAERGGTPLVRAASLYDGAARCAGMIGSAVGGLLIAALGAVHVFFLDSATFVVSAALVGFAVGRVPHHTPEATDTPEDADAPGHDGSCARSRSRSYRPHRPHRSYRRELAEGYRFVLASPLLVGMCLVALAAQALDQGWSNVLLPLDVRGRLGGAAVLGVLEALFSAGALVGALAYGAFGGRLRRRTVYAVSFLIVGAPRFFVAAGTASPAPLAVMMTVEGLACGTLNPIVATVIYDLVPERLRARVLSATTASGLLVAPLGGLAAGLLAQAEGVVPALVLAGAGYLLVTLCPLLLPAWRGMDGGAADGPGPAAAGPEATAAAPGFTGFRPPRRRRRPPPARCSRS